MLTTAAKYILVFFLCFIEDSTEIQNVKLILPTVVQAGKSATLLCLYDLEGAPLYSVQWYRGRFEFYRFAPNGNPSTKVFQIPGFNVDTLASNEHQVTLRNIPLQISGEISCEITTDTPRFSTSCVSKNLTVVDFYLSLNIPRKQYNFRDIIDANCSLTPNLPSTKLIFHWNSKPVSNKFVSNPLVGSAQLHLNTSFFYSEQKFPVLVLLKCSAVLNEMYYIESKSVFIKLNPIISPSRSTIFSSKINFFLLHLCIFIQVFNFKS